MKILLVILSVIVGVVAILVAGRPLLAQRLPSDETTKEYRRYLGFREFAFGCSDLPLVKTVDYFSAGPDLKNAVSAIHKGDFRQAELLLQEEALTKKCSIDSGYWLALTTARHGEGDMPGALEAADALRKLSHKESRIEILSWSVSRQLGIRPTQGEADKVLGVVIELGRDQGKLTIAGYADGDARMLASGGFCLLGDMTTIPDIKKASQELVEAAKSFVGSLPVSTERPLPEKGHDRFYILTPGGTHVEDVMESDVKRPGHRLFGLYWTEQQLISAFSTNQSKFTNHPPGL